MSCKDCDEFQRGTGTSYFRWGTANIEVRACSRHLKEVYAALREHLKQEVIKENENLIGGIKDRCHSCNGSGSLRHLGGKVPCPDCSSLGDLDT